MKWRWWVALSLAGCFQWAFVPSWAQEQGPKISIPETIFDFKDVREGEIIEHAFVVRNEGTETLHIADVKPG